MSDPIAPATSSSSVTPAPLAAPSVHFQPSASLMQTFDNDDASAVDESKQPSRNGKQQRGKQAQKAAAATAAAAAAAASASGNNSSPPTLSVKAERELRKKQQQQSSKSSAAAPSPFRSSKSRSPSATERVTSDGRHHDTEKKRPMRSVDDVLSRIRHDGACKGAVHAAVADAAVDGALSPASAAPRNFLSHFLIAYIDRVWGDQEIAFDEFFSNSDYKEIPMHRISYIRFFDEIVWSRAARYDAIFGSSNSSKTLPDWLREAPALQAAQEERWARMLAMEAAEAARDQRMLSQLGVQIAEQREEISAVLSRADLVSTATSGFDFTESGQRERMQEVEEAEIEEMEREEELQREAEIHEAMQQQAQKQEAAQSEGTAQLEVAAAPVAAMDWGGLPQRASTSRRAARAPTSSSSASSSAAPAVAATAPVTVAAPASTPDLFASSSPHPLREDDANISLTLSLFDAASGRVLRSSALRVSTAHFDFNFLKKRIASRLHIKGGSRDVKRMYLQAIGENSSARDNIKLTDMNFQTLLTEGCQLIVMAEAVSEHPASMMLQPAKGGGEKMEERDAARVRESKANQATPVVAASSASSIPSTPAAAVAASTPIDRSRPNYFVSLRITSPTILAKLVSVQESLVKYDGRYKSFLVPEGTFHITLSLLTIMNEQEVETAVRVMQENTQRMQQIMNGEGEEKEENSAPAVAAALSIRGLSSFGDKVLFADIARDSGRVRLNRVALLLTAAFHAAGVGCTEKKRVEKIFKEVRGGKGALIQTIAQINAVVEEEEGFTPHLTIAKMSRDRAPAGGKHSHHNKNSHKSRVQQQNTGMEDVDDAASADSLPTPAANAFSALALSRDPSESDAASPAAPAAAVSVSAPVFPPQSTSVIRRIDSDSYSSWLAYDFGTQAICSIDLCSMQGRKQEDGYYTVRGSVCIQQP